jgi:trimeric autotransporter adhesin
LVKRTLSIVAAVAALSLSLAERSAAQEYKYTINTLAGDYVIGDGGPGTKALLAYPYGVALDANGNLYIADYLDNRVRKVVLATGVITTIAGTGFAGFSGDGSAAVSAQINGPGSVVADTLGNVYFTDVGNAVIRKVDSSGNISTFAGTPGAGGGTGDGGPATKATLGLHAGSQMAVDAANNLYIADSLNSVIREVTVSNGNINTIAGTIGKNGSTGTGGPATSAMLYYPFGVAVDSSGNLYIADSFNQEIREVSAQSHTITTIAGTAGSAGSTGDGGPAAAALFNYPYSIAVDATGNLYIGDFSNDEIREITAGATPTINTIAGNIKAGGTLAGDGGPATSAGISGPISVAVNSAGAIYFADLLNNRVRYVSQGLINEVAGANHDQGDGGQATAAYLFFPQTIAEDGAGNLYIADTENNAIRKVTPTGIISTAAAVGVPQAVVIDSSGNLYATVGSRVLKVDTKGNVTVIAGNTSNAAGFSGDGGPASAAALNNPEGLALDSAGNLYIADSYNHRIREISAGTGNINTVAGSGGTCLNPCSLGSFSGDGGPATSATLSFPYGVAVDSAGNIYIADSDNHVIRKVTKGTISTVAGTGTKRGFGGDGGTATAALLDVPLGVAPDAAGNIFITDSANQVIRVVDGFGNINTVAGNNTPGLSGDGGPATSAQLYKPWGILVDPNANVLFVDCLNHRVRKLVATNPLVPGPNSVANAASFVHGGVVPGGMTTLFGSNLTTATGINLSSGLPLKTEFLTTSVEFAGKYQAPIFAVDNVNGTQQINFQVPWEIASLSTVLLQVTTNGVSSLPVEVPVLAAQPGVIAYNVGGVSYGVVLHSTFQLADTANPAALGETLTVYCVGLGAVSPALADGAPGTGAEITVATPTATIGGANAPVSFHGTAPGFVALYQVNVTVPQGLSSGNQPLVLTISGVSSAPVQLPVK